MKNLRKSILKKKKPLSEKYLLKFYLNILNFINKFLLFFATIICKQLGKM